jgi:predicted Zn-dependent protease
MRHHREQAARNRIRQSTVIPTSGIIRQDSNRSQGIVSSQAKRLAGEGRVADAIQLLESGIAEHPMNVFFLNQAAHLCKRNRQPNKAIEFCERSRRIDPSNMVTITTLGNLYLNQQRYDHFNKLVVATSSQGKNDATYLTVVAKGALLQHKPELARRTSYAALHNRPQVSAAAIYVAVAEPDDFYLNKLRVHFGETTYGKIEQLAFGMRGDPSLIESLDPGFAPRTSPVLESGGYYTRPANRAAVATFRRPMD